VRALAEARVPPADRQLQAARRVERDPPGRCVRVARRGLDDERGEHGAGRLLGRARARGARDRRRARPRASRQARRDRAARRPRRARPLRPLVGDDGGGLLPRARRPLRPPGARRARDGRQRGDRARAGRAPRRDRHGARALGRGWALDRHRERVGGGLARDRGDRMRAGRRRAPRRVVRGGRAEDGRVPRLLRRRRRLEGAPPGDVGARPAAARGRRRRAAPRHRRGRPSARDPGARRRGGRGGLALAAALAGHGGEGRVVCIVSGGNIDAATLAAILQGETPGE